jgi:hypothetical protein
VLFNSALGRTIDDVRDCLMTAASSGERPPVCTAQLAT